MAFYDDMQGIATELLIEFNQGVIKLIRLTPGTGPDYDPGEPTEKTFTLAAAARGVSQKYVDGTNILTSDMQVSAAVKAKDDDTGSIVDLAPDMETDKINVDGKVYNIVAVKPVPPAGVTVANIVIFRK